MRFPADEAAAAAVGNGAQPSVAGEDSAAVGAAGSVPPSAFAVGSEAADRSVLSAATASPAAASPRRRGGLMYSKSGELFCSRREAACCTSIPGRTSLAVSRPLEVSAVCQPRGPFASP